MYTAFLKTVWKMFEIRLYILKNHQIRYHCLSRN